MDNFDLKKYLAEGNLLKEMASANLELKSLAKNLFSTFKKMGAKVELSTGKVRLDKAPSGDLDEKNVWISVNDDVIELSLVGEEAAKNLPKIEATFSNFEFKDRGDSKSWNDQNVKNIAIMPGKGMSEALNENAPGYDTRKFGEALPTLESVKAAHEAKGEGYKDFVEDEEKEKLAKAGDLKEEAGMSELKMHLKQYQDGMIDGDDLANALEEIIYGSVTPPEYNTRYGR